MGIFSSKSSRERSKTARQSTPAPLPPADPTPPPSPPSPRPQEVVVVQPSSDAHAIIYKSEVEARKKEMRSMTEAKPVCTVYEDNPFKSGVCRACKHPKSSHGDPYADILNDLGGDDEGVAEESIQI